MIDRSRQARSHSSTLRTLREIIPIGWKVAFRRLRARVLDPLDRGIFVTISGQKVRVPAYFRGGGREDYETVAVERLLSWLETHRDAEIVDVGCSICLYGLIALGQQPNATVIGIDPDLPSLKCGRWICEKVGPERLGLVHGFVCAADPSGVTLTAALATTAAELMDRAVPKLVEMTDYRSMAESGPTRIPFFSLDTLFRGIARDKARLLKIDVEGHELAVLEGARDFLARLRPVILLSAHPQFFPRLGVDPAALNAFLDSAGYEKQLIAVDHEEHWWCEPLPTN